jgi:hypothetical protein
MFMAAWSSSPALLLLLLLLVTVPLLSFNASPATNAAAITVNCTKNVIRSIAQAVGKWTRRWDANMATAVLAADAGTRRTVVFK